jgi:hypothetical protein
MYLRLGDGDIWKYEQEKKQVLLLNRSHGGSAVVVVVFQRHQIGQSNLIA